VSSTPYGPANPDSQEYLTPEERLRMKRTLMFPEEFPKEFTDWLIDFLSVNGRFDKRQVSGISNFEVYPAIEITGEDTVSVGQTTFTDLGTVGPSLTGLQNGLYLVQYGGLARAAQADGSYAIESISVNGADPPDGIWAGATFSSVNKTVNVVLDQGNNNSIVCKYRRFGGSSAVTWRQRWMYAIRYGTL
jgi:hypothetical protein